VHHGFEEFRRGGEIVRAFIMRIQILAKDYEMIRICEADMKLSLIVRKSFAG
jgi:hypothetical protein